jgi:hypothetical protein
MFRIYDIYVNLPEGIILQNERELKIAIPGDESNGLRGSVATEASSPPATWLHSLSLQE